MPNGGGPWRRETTNDVHAPARPPQMAGRHGRGSGGDIRRAFVHIIRSTHSRSRISASGVRGKTARPSLAHGGPEFETGRSRMLPSPLKNIPPSTKLLLGGVLFVCCHTLPIMPTMGGTEDCTAAMGGNADVNKSARCGCNGTLPFSFLMPALFLCLSCSASPLTMLTSSRLSASRCAHFVLRFVVMFCSRSRSVSTSSS